MMSMINICHFIELRTGACLTALLLMASVFCAGAPVFATETSIEKILPEKACADGWVLEDKVKLYNKDNLFDRINGEAELYFPYGFESMASARYASRINPEHSVEADVYKMGSPLDAFGIYSSYRRSDDEAANAGAEGTVSSSLTLFYQGRYFVRLQASGVLNIEKDVFLNCARAIARNIPDAPARPSELEVFSIPSIVKGTERYIAKSLLGYEFLRRGLTADVMLAGKQVQFFVALENSGEAARGAFGQYRSYLGVPASGVQKAEGYIYLSATDPLFGKVMAVQKGRYVFGLIRTDNAGEAKKFLDDLGKKLRD